MVGKKKSNSIKNTTSGITLIALVITVIVLLILAGVTIAMISGENGIINRAQEAREATTYAQAKEEVMLEWADVQSEMVLDKIGNNAAATMLENKLKAKGAEAKDVTVTYVAANKTFEVNNYKGYDFEVQINDGKVTNNREAAKNDIQEIWTVVKKDSSLSSEEQKIAKLLEELKKKDANSTATKNEETGNIDITYKGYNEIIDEENNVTINSIKDIIIAEQPIGVEIFEGSAASFEVVAQTAGAATYQWYINSINSNTGGTDIAGATQSTYTVPDTSSEGEEYYYCEVTSTLEGETKGIKTNVAVLKIVKKLTDEQARVNEEEKILLEEENTSIGVTVQGGEDQNITYQWYKNSENNTEDGEIINNATQATYQINTARGEDEGYYYCVITQRAGMEENVIKSNTIKVTIKEKVTNPTTITDCEETYDGEAHTIEVSNDYVGGALQYSTDDGENKTWSDTKPTRTEVGTTTVYVRVNPDTMHTVATPEILSGVITINQAAVTLSDIPTGLQYVGKDSTNTFTSTATVAGVWAVTSSDENVSITGGNSVTASSNEISYTGVIPSETATTITIAFTPSDTTNYSTPTSQTFTVKATEITVSTNELTLIPGGEGQTVTLGGTNAGTYTLKNNNDENAEYLSSYEDEYLTATISNSLLTVEPKEIVAEDPIVLSIKESNGNKKVSISIEFEVPVTGNYGIQRGAKILDGYETLANAVIDAKDGETIEVLQDVEDNSDVKIRKNLNINLQGYTITRTSTIYITGYNEKNAPSVTITGLSEGKIIRKHRRK